MKGLIIINHQDMEIKITMKVHPITNRMSVVRNPHNNRSWWECEKSEPHRLVVGMYIGVSIVENSIETHK
jgi:hypothetical protein